MVWRALGNYYLTLVLPFQGLPCIFLQQKLWRDCDEVVEIKVDAQ